MKFSILSSIYHKEQPEHFDACMHSLWTHQTLPADEMILVADGRLPEALHDVIAQWQQRLEGRLRVIHLPQNVGTGRAKNIGLEHCSHDIVCIADTDDIYVPERFAKQIAFLQTHPDIDIVGGQTAEFIDRPDHTVSIRRVPCGHTELVRFAQRHSPFNNMTIAYRKQAILNIGGYRHHLWMEDYNLFLRAIASGSRLHNLPDILVHARIDNGMHGRRRGWRYIQSEKQLLQLKRQLHLQALLPAWGLFVARSCFRLLPVPILGLFYRYFLRQKSQS